MAGQYPGNIANVLSSTTVCNSIVHVIDQVCGCLLFSMSLQQSQNISTDQCLARYSYSISLDFNCF